MLATLSINNIALIDKLNIELGDGLNCLSGETGAGKSLIIDSISLLLGERADKSLISYGKTYAVVEAVFNNLTIEQKQALYDISGEEEDTIIITRKITIDGKNECRVNGRIYTLSMLRSLTTSLMDLHGQFEHQTLLNESNHIKVLDNYAGQKIAGLKQEYKAMFDELKNIKKQLAGFNVDPAERARLLEMYKYQIDEIEAAGFVEGEEKELKEFRMKVLSEEKIMTALGNALTLFEGGGYSGCSVSELVGKINGEIASISNYDGALKDILERLDSVKYELIDINESLDKIKEDMYFDENEAEANEKRLDLLSLLKRKYGGSIEDINLYLEKTKAEYDRLIKSEETVDLLVRQKNQLEIQLKEKGKLLSEKRKEIAHEFEEKMIAELVSLGMNHAGFLVEFTELEESKYTENGIDNIRFLFTANAGQPLRQLCMVASGGEMSRLMLSIKNVGGESVSASTMIFDEIDTGVSGHIAGVIAEKLATISKNHQVICVTHLSQIASYATNHYYIEKITENGQTKTFVEKIDGQKREQEIARLIGGKITNSSLEHAREMIADGIEYSKNL